MELEVKWTEGLTIIEQIQRILTIEEALEIDVAA